MEDAGSTYSRSSFTQSFRRSWNRLQRLKQEPVHKVMPDEQSEGAVTWLDELKCRVPRSPSIEIPYIDEESGGGVESAVPLGSQPPHPTKQTQFLEPCSAESRLPAGLSSSPVHSTVHSVHAVHAVNSTVHSTVHAVHAVNSTVNSTVHSVHPVNSIVSTMGIQSQISEMNFSDKMSNHKSNYSTGTKDAVERAVSCINSKLENLENGGEVVGQTKIICTGQPHFFKMFRGRLNAPHKALEKKEDEEPLKLPAWYTGVRRQGVSKSPTFPGYSLHFSKDLCTAPSQLVKEITIIEQAESKGAFGPRNSIKKRVIKQLQKTIQTLKQEIVEAPKPDVPPPLPTPATNPAPEETQDALDSSNNEKKTAVLKRRVSFKDDCLELKQCPVIPINPTLFCGLTRPTPPGQRILQRSISDLAMVQMAAKKMRTMAEKDSNKKKMIMDWSRTYEGMCVRAQKLEQAIECAVQEDLVVKPVHQIETKESISPQRKETARRRRSKKEELLDERGSFFSIYSHTSSLSVTSIDIDVSEKTYPQPRMEKSRSLDMGSTFSSLELNDEAVQDLGDQGEV